MCVRLSGPSSDADVAQNMNIWAANNIRIWALALV